MNYHYVLSKVKGYYIALINSKDGLVVNTIPSKNLEEVRDSIAPYLEKYKLTEPKITDNDLAKDIVALHLSPIENWSRCKEINLDHSQLSKKQQIVLETLRKTKPGETITYGALAEKSGFTNAARFVGNCMKINPTPLLIPCHRVLPANGSLGSYSAIGGTNTKRHYLRIEKADLQL